MVQIKICGVTTAADAQAAAAAGAAAVGLVCHAPGAARRLSPGEAAAVLAGVPAAVVRMLLFVDAPAATVAEFAALDPAAWLQFHGAEDAAFCASFGRPYLKAVKPRSPADFAAACAAHPAAEAIILDGGGGTGETFDWSLVPPPAGRPKPLVLAGGISPANAAAAIARTRPDWIDVSSGACVDGDPRRKDPAKLAALRAAAAAVPQEEHEPVRA